MSSPQSTVAERLRGEVRAEMARQRVTRKELADRSGIPLHALDRRLGGHVEFTFPEAERIAAGLGIPYAELVSRVEGDAA